MRPNIPMLLRNAVRAIDRLLADHGRAEGVTERQMAIILILSTDPGLTSAEVGRRLSIDKATMSKVMRRLVQKKLVKQDARDDGARGQQNILTPAGQEKARACQKIDAEVQARVNAKVASVKMFHVKLEAIAALKE